MSRVSRFLLKIFAQSAANNGQFGSAQTGAKLITDDPTEIQDLPAWDLGWLEATIDAQRLPPLEEEQALDYVITTSLSYLYQQGIPEYFVDETYYEFSLARAPGTYILYGSITDDNIGNSTSNPTYWKYVVNLETVTMTSNTVSVDNEIALYSGTGGRDLKRATTTGLLKAASGVLSAAVAGTDYYSPANLTTILAAVYPVGSYYINETDSTNPATLLGFGTWAAILDKFIVAHGSTYTSTGGAATVTLSAANIPTITSTITLGNGTGGASSTYIGASNLGGLATTAGTTAQAITSNNTGSSPFSIIPVYQAAYIWKRTA